MLKRWGRVSVLLPLLLLGGSAMAQPGLPAVTLSEGAEGTEYTLTLQLLALMSVLTLLPSLLLMMTSFVRIIITLSLLRQALGTAQTPPNQVLVGLALFLTLFVMAPVFETIYTEAAVPYLEERATFDEALAAAEAPLRTFMLNQTRGNGHCHVYGGVRGGTGGDAGGRAVYRARAGLRHQRAKKRLRHRVYSLHSLCGD